MTDVTGPRRRRARAPRAPHAAEREYQALRASTGDLAERRLTELWLGDWSVKEIVAHIVAPRNPREAATCVALLAGVAVWATLQGAGPFGRYTQNESLLLLGAFIATMAVASTSRFGVDDKQKAMIERAADGALYPFGGIPGILCHRITLSSRRGLSASPGRRKLGAPSRAGSRRPIPSDHASQRPESSVDLRRVRKNSGDVAV